MIFAASPSMASPVAQLTDLLIRAVCGPSAPVSAADVLRALSAVPAEPLLEPAEDDAAAGDILDRLERMLTSLPRSDGASSTESVETLRSARRQLIRAGRAGSPLAAFKRKASLLTVLEMLAFSTGPEETEPTRVAPRVVALLTAPPPSAHTHETPSVAAAHVPTVLPDARNAAAALSSRSGQVRGSPEPIAPQPLVASGAAPSPASHTHTRVTDTGAQDAIRNPSREPTPAPARPPLGVHPSDDRSFTAATATASPSPTTMRVSAHTRTHTHSLPAAGSDAAAFTAAARLFLSPEDEATLLTDCLRVLAGVHGTHVRFLWPATCDRACALGLADVAVELLKRVPQDTPTLHIPAHVADMLSEIARCGDEFRLVCACLDAEPRWDADAVDASVIVGNGGVTPRGAVRQAFVAAIRKEADAYLSDVAQLEADVSAAGGAEAAVRSCRMSVQRVLDWTARPRRHLHLLRTLCAATRNLHGSAVISAVHAHLSHADRAVHSVVQRVLGACVVPLVTQIREWVATGELRAHQHITASHRLKAEFTEVIASIRDADFFICCDDEVLLHDAWERRFALCMPHVPAFMSRATAEAVFNLGKTVHFIRVACNDAEWIVDNVSKAVARLESAGLLAIGSLPSTLSIPAPTAVETPTKQRSSQGEHEEDIASLLTARKLTESVSGADFTGAHAVEALLSCLAPIVNRRLLSLVMDSHKLLHHLRALQRYILLTQGDFVSILLASIAPELGKPAGSMALARHVLEGFVESAIRASNAQYEDKDVLNRISVYMLAPAAGDTGWDVFSLAYHVDAPLSTVITPGALTTYARVFHFLWRVKRVEYGLSSTWSTHMTASHSLRSLRHAGLDAILHTCHLLRTDMLHFTSTLVSYLTYEALTSAWDALRAQLDAAKEFSDVLAAHDVYMHTVVDRALLSDRTRSVAGPIQALLAEVLKFAQMQDILIDAALEQVALQRAFQRTVRRRLQSGTWGVPSRDTGAAPRPSPEADDEDADLEARVSGHDEESMAAAVADALDGIVAAYGPPLAQVATAYRSCMMSFLAGIDAASQADGLGELKLLTLRFDFNGYYCA